MNVSPAISVIVPVYKVENFVSQCIKSILEQSFTDFELLLVDDGSPDNSGKICDEWSQKDNRIRVFHQNNAGVSAARNRGLAEALGRYVVFVDSDDWVLSGYLEHLYAFAGRGLVLQGYMFGTEDGMIKKGTYFPKTGNYELPGFKDFFLGKDVTFLPPPWNKLYDMQLIREHKLMFDEKVSFGEDALFVYYYILHCDFIVTAEYADYIYRETTSGLSTKINSFDSEYAFFKKQYAFVRELAYRLEIQSDNLNILFKFSLLFFQRTLRTDYLLCHQVPYSVRIAHLKQLVSENEEFFKLYYKPDYKLDKLGRFMLKKRMFGLYDFCFQLLFHLRVRQIFLGNSC